MARIFYTPSLIELPVTDRVYQDTVFKQKARYDSLTIAQAATGNCTLHLWVVVSMYAKDGDDYGLLLPTDFVPRRLPLLADNNTLVDPAAGGAIAYMRTTETEAEWAEVDKDDARELMPQGDFFCLLRDTQDVRIHDIIAHHIQQADAMGKFA